MSDFIWGLTVRDIENAFSNSMSGCKMVVGGMAVAAAVNALFRYIIPDEKTNKADDKKHIVSTAIGIVAGVLVSFRYVDRLPHVTFAAEKALKFLVISIVTGSIGMQAGPLGLAITLITGGGAWGYFGRSALHVGGAIGAVIGSILRTSTSIK